MIKKRLSIIALIALIIMSVCLVFARSKVETPDEHAENAVKITMVAEQGKTNEAAPSADSSTKEVKEDKTKAKDEAADSNIKENDETKTEKKDDTKQAVEKTEQKKAENKEEDKQKFEKPDPSKVDKTLVQTPTSGANPNDSSYTSLVDNANHHTDSNKKDKYLTDPTPPGMPTPVEPQDVKIDANSANYCTLSIRCDTILENRQKLKKNKECMVPDNGVIYETKKVVYYKGESVFNVLVRETAKNRIQMDFQNTPIYNSAYIKGIHNLYEFDCGSLSGWMYKVNGWFPNYGCSRYQLKPGDKIEWVYTCDLGRDVGCVWIGDKK